MSRRYASDDDPEDIDMYGQKGWDDIDIDGKDSNGNFPEGSYRWGRCTSDDQPEDSYTPPRPHAKYQFYTEEELITSPVFQRCLGQALAFKDKEIAQLRQELMNKLFFDL